MHVTVETDRNTCTVTDSEVHWVWKRKKRRDNTIVQRHARGGTRIIDPASLGRWCLVIQGGDESRLIPLGGRRWWCSRHLQQIVGGVVHRLVHRGSWP
jgi:hypothetical protein